jgi:hypothetical protein
MVDCDDGDGDDNDGASMPRNASRKVIAESGRFMTKCAIRLRDGRCEEISPCDCCRACARRCDCESGGPAYPGKGSTATRAAACRMKSRPSSQDARTRSETYMTHVVCGSVGTARLTHLVILYINSEIFVTLGIQIIGQYCTAFFGRGQRKRAHTSKHVCYQFIGPEHIHKTRVFRVQPRIPIHLGKIKFETTV